MPAVLLRGFLHLLGVCQGKAALEALTHSLECSTGLDPFIQPQVGLQPIRSLRVALKQILLRFIRYLSRSY